MRTAGLTGRQRRGDGDHAGVGDTFGHALRPVLFITITALMGREPIVALLFKRGAFGAVTALTHEYSNTLISAIQTDIQGWGNRKQVFRWVNGIDYRFGPNGKKSQILHVVECQERWQGVSPQTGQLEDKSSRHVWLSSKPLNRFNLHERCNLGARARWGIETGILVEKHHGYRYEHCFSYDLNVMKGYHYLMRLGHMFNVLARYSERLDCVASGGS